MTNKSKDKISTILTVAGSDPTGGAAIQADLKTMTAFACYGAAAVTCITVQNSYGVSRIEPLEPGLVKEQVEAVLADHHVTCIKIGMVGNKQIIRVLVKLLRNFSGMVVYDPVLAASSGHSLLQNADLNELRDTLLQEVTVLTPNLLEFGALTGISNPEQAKNDQLLDAGKKLLQGFLNLQALVIKGGHGSDNSTCCDQMLYKNETGVQLLQHHHPRIPTRNSHGTGCTFATALACLLTEEFGFPDAFTRSCEYLQQVLGASNDHTIIKNQKGNGPLLHWLGMATGKRNR
jgi:hydroxymethylpyrimidine/phosphomethylpyrimidine kinase